MLSKSGKTLYQGQMFAGTLDGDWLLTLTLDELKEALGDAHTTSIQEDAQSFLVSCPELGLVARCSYQSEESESEVYSIYLYKPKDENWIRLLPGMDSITLKTPQDVTDRKTDQLQFNPPAGVEVKAGNYDSTMLYTDDTRTTLLRQSANGPSVLLTWSRTEPLPSAGEAAGGGAGGGSGGAGGAGGAGGGAGGGSGSAAAAEEEMEAFLDALDGMEGAGGVESVPNEYCGDTNPTEALRACTTPEQVSAVVDAMTDYWFQSETQAGLEENLRRVQGQLDDANAGKTMGTTANTRELEQQKVTLEAQIASCQNQRARAQVAAKQSAGVDPAEYSAGDMLVKFDPASLDVSSLVPTAAAYATATGEEADPEALELEIKTLLVEMKDSYAQMQSSIESYRLAAEQAQSAATSYAMGQSDKNTWFSSLSSEVDAKLELFAATAEFTKQANSLNSLTGGWVSRNCNWYGQEMGSVYENAMKEASVETPSTVPEAVLSD